jgi:hypothetical protein
MVLWGPEVERMYLIYDTEEGVFRTLRKEVDSWVLAPSGREALWAPVISSMEELREMGICLPGFPIMRGVYRRIGKGLALEPEGEAGELLPSYMLVERVTDGYPDYVLLEYTRPDPKQWLMAWALAQDYGHGWGLLLAKEELEAALVASSTNQEVEVRIYSALRDEVGPFGGIFPKGTVQAGKYILSHITTTGRVYWEVRPGGGVGGGSPPPGVPSRSRRRRF